MTVHVPPPASVDLDQARRFLAKAVPWPVNGDGYINIIWSEKKPGTEQPIWSGRACRTLDEAVGALTWITKKQGKREIYVCMSSQRLAEEKISRNGYKYLAPIRNQQNVIALKSLYLDIDFKGGDHGYDTPDDAINAIAGFLEASGFPKPSMIVKSGGGLHIYFTLSRPLSREEWQPLAHALAEAGKRHGLKADWQVTTNSARILRIPGTTNNKQDIPRPVTLAAIKEMDLDPAILAEALKPYTQRERSTAKPLIIDPMLFPPRPPLPPRLHDELGAGIRKPEYGPIHLDDLAKECAFIRDAIATGGASYANPLWNLTTLAATFSDDPRNDAHRMGNKHPHYSEQSTDELLERKQREREQKGLGFPRCIAIANAGCTRCESCSHFSKARSPLSALPPRIITELEASFADPYAEFTGPAFPTSILPSILAKFVEAEHQAMGADPSALAMAAIAGIGAALTSETKVQVGDGWYERPILNVALVGDPSTMKSPVIEKATHELRKIDHGLDSAWRTSKAAWQQLKAGNANPAPCPPKPPRCIIQDATPEKIAEILSRHPRGSLMVQDELAGFLASFDRYGAGAAARGFYLTCFNGGPYLKDRVGQGVRDDNAEIRVENLALCTLGGVQPDRLSNIRDLTSDGLLQRFLFVNMRAAQRGNEKHPVTAKEAAFAQVISSVYATSPITYRFSPTAEPVLERVLDRLYDLEQVQGFSSALIGAIGKLKGYYARLALILQVAAEHTATIAGQRIAAGGLISKNVAEATERLLFDFLLPHTFALYDVVANGGQDRDTIRAIGDFILASDKDRLRPSDITAGVRRLRSQPGNKIAEWASRFCALGWLNPEQDNGNTPKAWLVEPGLRTYFAARRQQAQKARAEAHAILKAGGQP